MDQGNSGGQPQHGPRPYGPSPYGPPGPWSSPAAEQPPPADGASTGAASPGYGPPGSGPLPGQQPPPAGHQVPAAGHQVPAAGSPGGTGAQAGAPAGAATAVGARYDPWAPPGSAGFGPVGSGGPGTPYGPARPGDPPGPPEPRRGLRLTAGALAVALAAGLTGGTVGVLLERGGTFSAVHLDQTISPERVAEPGTVTAIAADVLPGVVTFHVRGGGGGGTGTGFVLDDDGHILTNAHVVAPAQDGGDIQVTFSEGEAVRAELVGLDTGYDLAVVRVDSVSGLSPLPLGDSDGVRVGDPVVAVGSPFELDGTVTSGIVSAVNRPITAGGDEGGSDISYVDALQTDAPINPGNSGGPLVDVDGLVIGINSAIRTPDVGGLDPDAGGGSVGLGFAIPVNQAKRIAEELINTGQATHPVLGVHIDMGYTGSGARVGSSAEEAVLPDGPGDRAGIEEGDVITAVDGERVRGGDELIVRVRTHRPGDVLLLTVERGDDELELEVELGRATTD